MFGHQQMDPIGRIPKNDASKPWSFEDVFIAGDTCDNRSNKTLAALKCLLRRFRRCHVPPSNDFCDSKKPCNQTRLQGLNVLVERIARSNPLAVRLELRIVGRVSRLEPHTARRSDYADGRGPLETRMVIVAPAAALDGVWPTTFPVATLSS